MVVYALDGFNEVDTGFAGTVTFASTDPSSVIPLSYTFTTADQGGHLFSRAGVLYQLGSQTISASANGVATGTWSVTVDPEGGPVPNPTMAGVFKTYPGHTSGAPTSMTIGDGDLWFTEPDANKIGRLRLLDGSVEEFAVPTPNAGLAGIASTTSTGSLLVWFTESAVNKIGVIQSDGIVTEFDVPTPASEPWGIASDFITEQLWFTERSGNAVARIHPDGEIEEFRIPTTGAAPTGIALVPVNLGVDVWFTEPGRNAIGRRTASPGTFQEIPIPTPASDPREIVYALNGALWFTERAADRIGRVSGDVVTELPLPTGSRPTGIAAELSRGEFLWFTEPGTNRVGFVTLEGQVTEYPVPRSGSELLGIVTDGYEAWFAAADTHEIVRVEPDVDVFVGFGFSGPWTSSLELANAESTARSVFLGTSPFPPSACPGQCTGVASVDLAASGTAPFGAEPRYGFPDLTLLYARPLGTGILPSVHFRYANILRPTLSADAPVARLSTITALDPLVLSFPSAARGAAAKSNLFVSNVGRDGDASGIIEAFAPDGTPLGSKEFSVPIHSLMPIPDVLGRLGAPDIENAQVRVTKSAGGGLLWGSLATVREDEETLSVTPGVNSALPSDLLLIAGGGLAGAWDTVLDFSNPGSAGIAGEIRWQRLTSPPPCPPGCLDATYSVPADGTARRSASEFLPKAWSGPRLLATTGAAVVHARVVNRAQPTQAADLPMISLAALLARNPQTLVFPSASRGSGVRTNLYLVGIGAGAEIQAHVEALSPAGELLAEGHLVVVSWDGPGSTFVVDLLGQLGIAELQSGQVRVTRESGGSLQLLWGVLSNVYDDGRLSVIVGLDP